MGARKPGEERQGCETDLEPINDFLYFYDIPEKVNIWVIDIGLQPHEITAL